MLPLLNKGEILAGQQQRQKGDKNQLVRIFLEDMVKKGCVTNTCTSSNGLLKLNLIDKVQYERMQFIENDHHDDEEEGNGEGSNKTSSKYSYKED